MAGRSCGSRRKAGRPQATLDGREPRKLLDHKYGRFRTAVVAPDGALWVTTSNLDRGGREAGIPVTPEGDRILRVTL